MEVGESHIFQEVTEAKNQVPLLDRLWQAQSRMERSYARAQRELERLQGAWQCVRTVPETQSDEEDLPEEEDLPCEEVPADPEPKPRRNSRFIPLAASAAESATPVELSTLEPKGKLPS